MLITMAGVSKSSFSPVNFLMHARGGGSGSPREAVGSSVTRGGLWSSREPCRQAGAMFTGRRLRRNVQREEALTSDFTRSCALLAETEVSLRNS